MKGYPVSYITNGIQHYTKLSKSMDSKTTIQCNKLMHLENSILMYGIYNMEMLKKLIKTVHDIHNTTSLHERLFAGQQSSLMLRTLYANSLGLHHYFINSLLYIRTVQDKYIALYMELIAQLCIYFSKRIFANFTSDSFKIERNSQ